MKNVFKLLAAFVFLAAFLTGCEKEQEISEPAQKEKIIAYKNANPDYVPNYKKDMIITEEGAVTDRYSHVYRTLIIGNQEWLLEDLYGTRTLFPSKIIYPGDVTTTQNAGINHGCYYRWPSVIDGTTQAQWDYLFTLIVAPYTISSGFHVPTPNDMNTLVASLGLSEFIPEYLELQADGWYHTSQWWGSTSSAFWLSDNSNPNRVAGCGVFAQFDSTNNLWYTFTNIPLLCTNVRLVRSI